MRVLLLLLLLFAANYKAQAQAERYDQQHPVVVVLPQRQWPYAFSNYEGLPEGYNVELMQMVMGRLKLPYRLHLEPMPEHSSQVDMHKATLTFSSYEPEAEHTARYGKAVVNIFTHSLVLPRRQSAINIRTPRDLRGQKIYVQRGSYIHRFMKRNRMDEHCVPVDDIRQALRLLNKQQDGVVALNAMMQKWLMSEEKLPNLKAIPFNMPPIENKPLSHDTVLLARIDSVIGSLAAEDLRPLNTRWFYPERSGTGIPSWVWNVAEALVVLLVLLTAWQLVIRLREQRLYESIRRNNAQLGLILQSSLVKLYVYDTDHNSFFLLGENGQRSQPIDPIEMSRDYAADDAERFRKAIGRLRQGQSQRENLLMRQKSDEQETRLLQVTLGVLGSERDGVSSLIITMRDATQEQRQRQRSRELLKRSQVTFNTAMSDIAYYDEKGRVTEMNARAYATFGIAENAKLRGSGITLYDAFNLDLDTDLSHGIHATAIIDPGDQELPSRYTTRRGMMCYEYMLMPVYNDEGVLICYVVSGTDVSDTVNSYRALRQQVDQLDATNRQRSVIVNNIRQVIQLGGLRLITYSPDTHTLDVYAHDDSVRYSFTQARALSLLLPESYKDAVHLISVMDHRKNVSVDQFFQTRLRLKGGLMLHVQLHLVPILDQDGKVLNYYGLCRDVSEQMALEQHLQQEMAKAREIEQVKSAFLKNMSYEIRTPLNAVVGFAGLFNQPHDLADETVFVGEIKKNSDYLLRLINNILYLSRLNAHMVEVQPKPVDMADCFEIHCKMGWEDGLKPGVKTLLEQPYQHLIINTDEQMMCTIIEHLASLAAIHTHSGRIKASLSYFEHLLTFTFDDTGPGMTQNEMMSISGNVSQGSDTETGLKMATARQLVELLGGHMAVESESGRGTTIVVTLPCLAEKAERKVEA